MSIRYSNNKTIRAISTLAIWCHVVHSRDVRSRDFSRPCVVTHAVITSKPIAFIAPSDVVPTDCQPAINVLLQALIRRI